MLLRHVAADRPVRVLDVGCGTGETLVEVARKRQHAECVGLDVSPANIATAAGYARDQGCGANTRWIAADYLAEPLEPADVVFSEGVIHLIPGQAEAVLRKLRVDLASDGKLLLVIPYRCTINALIILARRMLRALRNQALDEILLSAARRLYPSWPLDVLRERVEYMYILPFHLDGHAWRAQAERCGLRLVEAHPWPNTSIAKLRHRLLVFERAR